MHIFHNWGKWKTYESKGISYLYSLPYISTTIRQCRECIDCGKLEDEYIRAVTCEKIYKDLKAKSFIRTEETEVLCTEVRCVEGICVGDLSNKEQK